MTGVHGSFWLQTDRVKGSCVESSVEKVDLRLPLRGHEGKRNDCFSKIQLVGQKYRDKTTLAS